MFGIRWPKMVFMALLGGVVALGCVQRRLIVRSNPPGARVIVDDTYEMGITPVAFSYTYYGTRKIKLIRDGYETLTVYQSLPAPWYQWPVLDFITENLIPWEIRDERVVEYQLRPQAVVPTEQLIRRAGELRRVAHGGQLPPVRPTQTPASGSPGTSAPPTPPAPTSPPAPQQPNPYLPPGGFVPPPVPAPPRSAP